MTTPVTPPSRSRPRRTCSDALALAGLLLLVGVPASAQDAAVHVAARATVAAVELPPKRDGGRDARYALGKRNTAELARELVENTLRRREVFDEVAPDASPAEGDHVLELRLEKASNEFRDLSAMQSRRSPLTATSEVSYRWHRDGRTLHEGGLTVRGVVELDAGERPTRGHFREAWERLLAEAAVESFAEAYRARAFGNAAPPDGWLPFEATPDS